MTPHEWMPRTMGERAMFGLGAYCAAWLALWCWLEWAFAWALPSPGVRMAVAGGLVAAHVWWQGCRAVGRVIDRELAREGGR